MGHNSVLMPVQVQIIALWSLFLFSASGIAACWLTRLFFLLVVWQASHGGRMQVQLCAVITQPTITVSTDTLQFDTLQCGTCQVIAHSTLSSSPTKQRFLNTSIFLIHAFRSKATVLCLVVFCSPPALVAALANTLTLTCLWHCLYQMLNVLYTTSSSFALLECGWAISVVMCCRVWQIVTFSGGGDSRAALLASGNWCLFSNGLFQITKGGFFFYYAWNWITIVCAPFWS